MEEMTINKICKISKCQLWLLL